MKSNYEELVDKSQIPVLYFWDILFEKIKHAVWHIKSPLAWSQYGGL